MSSWSAARKRPRGRHTSLIGGADDDADPMAHAFDDWPPPGLTDVLGTGTRVRIRGEEPPAASDTVVLGDLGLFREAPATPRSRGVAGPAPRHSGTGLDRPVPRPPWYRQRWPLFTVTAGLAIIAVAGFLGVPPLLAALGIGSRGACALCQFPIPSSGAIAPNTSGPSPVASSAAPHRSHPAPAASTPSTPAQVVAPQPAASTPSAPPPTVGVTYTAIPTGGGSFTGQVTVVNRGTDAITGWQLVVALPGDTVSAVQNAEFTDDNDVLFLTPAPYDLSIAPGATATISIFAAGADSTPAECSFNNIGCQLAVLTM